MFVWVIVPRVPPFLVWRSICCALLLSDVVACSRSFFLFFFLFFPLTSRPFLQTWPTSCPGVGRGVFKIPWLALQLDRARLPRYVSPRFRHVRLWDASPSPCRPSPFIAHPSPRLRPQRSSDSADDGHRKDRPSSAPGRLAGGLVNGSHVTPPADTAVLPEVLFALDVDRRGARPFHFVVHASAAGSPPRTKASISPNCRAAAPTISAWLRLTDDEYHVALAELARRTNEPDLLVTGIDRRALVGVDHGKYRRAVAKKPLADELSGDALWEADGVPREPRLAVVYEPTTEEGEAPSSTPAELWLVGLAGGIHQGGVASVYKCLDTAVSHDPLNPNPSAPSLSVGGANLQVMVDRPLDPDAPSHTWAHRQPDVGLRLPGVTPGTRRRGQPVIIGEVSHGSDPVPGLHSDYYANGCVPVVLII